MDRHQCPRFGYPVDPDFRSRICIVACPRLKTNALKQTACLGNHYPIEGDKAAWVDALRQALLASKIISYAQGFMLIREASENNDWALNYGNTAPFEARRLHYPQRVLGQHPRRIRSQS